MANAIVIQVTLALIVRQKWNAQTSALRMECASMDSVIATPVFREITAGVPSFALCQSVPTVHLASVDAVVTACLVAVFAIPDLLEMTARPPYRAR